MSTLSKIKKFKFAQKHNLKAEPGFESELALAFEMLGLSYK